MTKKGVFGNSLLVLCQFVFFGLEYKALALSDSTKLKLCTPKKQIDRVLDILSWFIAIYFCGVVSRRRWGGENNEL
ncbi:membrane protein [Candidatus Thiomargarita nelsonii]|uniref:Membrane protein n=1 Tax=Candidatus Thiomargarita nelsonii TaxID=1003181 RepID=A0A176S3F9_9GAMM|nr:membrane protein [Candidatus Thiomargarita nelsonii]